MSRPLTDRQTECLTFIVAYIAEHGQSPTLREIGDAMGISSPNGVNDHLLALRRKGYVARTPHVARGLVVVSEAP